MRFDHELVAIGCGHPNIGLGVERIPGAQPSGYRVLLATAYIQFPHFFNSGFQFRLDRCLGFAQYAFNDPLAGLGIIAGSIPPLPSAIFS